MDYQPLDIVPSSPEPDSESLSRDSSAEEAPNMSHSSLPYGGVPNRACIEWLEDRDDDGWDNRCSSARDWSMSIDPSWGSQLDCHPVNPLVNLRSDFGAVGLSWEGAAD